MKTHIHKIMHTVEKSEQFTGLNHPEKSSRMKSEGNDDFTLFYAGMVVLTLEILILLWVGWINFLPVPHSALSIWLLMHQNFISKKWHTLTGKEFSSLFFYPVCLAISLIGLL
jgi:hypothetical protein